MSGAALVNTWLEAIGVDAERLGDRDWTLRVPTTAREVVPVTVRAEERTLTMRAFVMRGPDRNRQDFYDRVLRKNLDMRTWRFAVDDAGDLWLAADAETAVLGSAGLDGLLGLLSTYVDETYEGLVRLGFDVPEGQRVTGGPPRARD